MDVDNCICPLLNEVLEDNWERFVASLVVPDDGSVPWRKYQAACLIASAGRVTAKEALVFINGFLCLKDRGCDVKLGIALK